MVRKSPLKNQRVTVGLTLPWRPVPRSAPRTAPGTAQTIRFQGMAERPPCAASWTMCVSAAPTTVPASRVNKVLGELAAAGLIEVSYRNIRVVDADRLAEVT